METKEMEFKRIDEIFDPKNNISNVLKKPNPRLALDITPTIKHDPCHDLFRIYTFRLLKELSKNFEIILIYRDLQATVDLPIEESKRLIEENISLMRGSNTPFSVFYESEILRNHLTNLPEKFFKHLYKNVLHKGHNHPNKPLMFSSTSLAILLPLLELLKIDVLLCMSEEMENIKILHDILKESEYFPVVFYRSLRDFKNKKHSPSDKVRAFPRIDWDKKKIYDNLIKYNTNLETLQEWYEKLNLDENKILEINKEKISFNKLVNLIKSNELSQKKLYEIVSKHLSEFLFREGTFLEMASKEFKKNLTDKNLPEIVGSLNSASRIKIIQLLNGGDFSAYHIAKSINLSLPTTLFHLKKLQKIGIVERKNRIYHLNTNRFILYV